jgi:hypothetical protein
MYYKQLLNDLGKTRRYGILQSEVPDCTVSRTRFERDYGPVVRLRDDDDDDDDDDVTTCL